MALPYRVFGAASLRASMDPARRLWRLGTRHLSQRTTTVRSNGSSLAPLSASLPWARQSLCGGACSRPWAGVLQCRSMSGLDALTTKRGKNARRRGGAGLAAVPSTARHNVWAHKGSKWARAPPPPAGGGPADSEHYQK